MYPDNCLVLLAALADLQKPRAVDYPALASRLVETIIQGLAAMPPVDDHDRVIVLGDHPRNAYLANDLRSDGRFASAVGLGLNAADERARLITQLGSPMRIKAHFPFCTFDTIHNGFVGDAMLDIGSAEELCEVPRVLLPTTETTPPPNALAGLKYAGATAARMGDAKHYAHTAALTRMLGLIRATAKIYAATLTGMGLALPALLVDIDAVTNYEPRAGFVHVNPVHWDALGEMAALRAAILLDLLDNVRPNATLRHIGLGHNDGLIIDGNNGCGPHMIDPDVDPAYGIPFLYVPGNAFLPLSVGARASDVSTVFTSEPPYEKGVLFFAAVADFCNRRYASAHGDRVSVVPTMIHALAGFAHRTTVFLLDEQPRNALLANELMRNGRMAPQIFVGLNKNDASVELFPHLHPPGQPNNMAAAVPLAHLDPAISCPGSQGEAIHDMVRADYICEMRTALHDTPPGVGDGAIPVRTPTFAADLPPVPN